MFDPQKIIAVFDICPSPAVIWPRAGYNIISVTYYSIFVVRNQLKWFFSTWKIVFSCTFPDSARSASRTAPFSRARSDFVQKRRSFRVFLNKNQHFSQFLLLIFVRSSSPPRQCAQNFLCILYKTAENPPAIFYRCTALKPRIFPCAGVAKRLPFACKEEPYTKI